MAPKLFSLILLYSLASILPATNASERLDPRDNDADDVPKTGGAYEAYEITMPLDHFNEDETRIFQNRFFINDTYYKPGGPVFLKPGAESPVDEAKITSFLAPLSGRQSAVISLAAEFNGLAVMLEHRYYGLSQPFEYDNETGILLDADNYEFLTLEQGLEDIVYFSTHLPPMTPELEPHRESLDPGTTPWVMLGGSYTGVQSAVMRVRNPDIIFASWASSAPVESQADMSTMGNALQRAMPRNCSADIHEAVTFIDEALGGSNDTARDLVGSSLYLAVQAKHDGEITEANVTTALRAVDRLSLHRLSRYMDHWRSDFQSTGLQEVWLFCDALETFNPEEIEGNEDYTANFNNSRDAEPTAEGLAAVWSREVVVNAFFSALWKRKVELDEDTPAPDPVGNPADFPYNPSWTWQRLSEYGGWWTGNASDPLRLNSVHITVDSYKEYDAWRINVTVPDNAPNTATYSKYGGWAINPPHVMFTDGTWDNWMARSVLASSEDGGLGRVATAEIPACNSAPPDDAVFGLVYEGAGHADDLTWARGKMKGFNYSGYPIDEGLPLFVDALRLWLPCFEGHETVPTDTSAQDSDGESNDAASPGRSLRGILAWCLWWAGLAALGLYW